MRQTFKNTFLAALILIFNSSLIYAQDIEFNRIVPDDATGFGYVNDITQDEVGFMWFATNRGLYRYDGNQLFLFKNDSSNHNSISAGIINTVYADSHGIIWIGSRLNGLDRYNSKTGVFTHFKHNPNDPASIANGSITDILRDHKGKLWIGTNNGLDQFDPQTNGFVHFKPVKGEPTSLSDLRVHCLYEDKQGTLWIGTGNRWVHEDDHEPEYGGLNRYKRETGTFTQYRSKPNAPNSLKSNKITSIFEDKKGVLWVATHRNGLYQMNRKKGTFNQMVYDPAHPEIFGNPETRYPGESIEFITQDTLGGYWIGKNLSALQYFNPAEGKMVALNGDEMGAYEPPKVAFTSRDGVLWFGGKKPGTIYKVNLLQKKIPSPFVSSEQVNVLYEEADGTFWIGKTNDLLRIDAKNGDTLTFNTELNFLPDSANNIFDIIKDSNGDVWVGASSGLYKWNAINQTFTGYFQNPNDEDFLRSNGVSAIFEDSRQNFMVGTFDGLYTLERSTGQFTHVTKSSNYFVTDLTEDKSGNIWITFWNKKSGVTRYNPFTESIKTYQSNSSFHFVFQDSDSVIWIGGSNSILTYDNERDDFFPLNNSLALFGLSIFRKMEEDNQKNIWITTPDAIVKINPEREKTSIYGYNFGIEPQSLSYWSIHKGVKGDIFIGNTKGYYQINPANFPENAKPSEIFFTRLLLSNQVVNPVQKGYAKQPLQHTKTIQLPYHQNVFSIDFSIIDYAHPEDTRMLYYLENYDNTWVTANARRRASYFDVPPGNYVFHVKGCNSNGIWTENKIEVIILPPWYRGWLAYIIYALLLMVAIFTFNRFMHKRIIRKERQKTQERELAQAKEIEKAYKELEISHQNLKSTQSQLIQSEKMASLGELTAGIAHEIQNPLNFVNNFSEVSNELVDEMKEEFKKGDVEEGFAIADDIKQNLEKITLHGKRADDIVKGMLQHSRTSAGQKEPTDINALADEYLRLSYHGLRAKDKSFNAEFKLEADENLPKINVIPQDIGRVLLNLINNAFYAVNEKLKNAKEAYKPVVTVSTKLLNDKEEIRVKDNGLGIPDYIKDKIFQPFFTTKPTGSGTGLGLSLSYDIIKAHGGELKVETKEGEGTEFIIVLPMNA